MSEFHNNSIFWVEVDKISSNPFQPRKDFNEEKLNELADSIRQYGVLQPLVVTRKEIHLDDGGIRSEYEIIAGERRLRASKIAGLSLIPVIIRTGEDDDKTKLEIAIIENLQREDLNPIDRAKAFKRLAKEFKFKHGEIAKKVGKSRVYVSNTIRLLNLPEEIQNAITEGKVPEGHARSILTLEGRPEEQMTLFKEVIYKKITAREAEEIARNIAVDKRRKNNQPEDPHILELQGKLSDNLGTRVQIEKRQVGGKIVIDYFSKEDLEQIIESLHAKKSKQSLLDRFIAKKEKIEKEENSSNESKKVEDKKVDLYESSNISNIKEDALQQSSQDETSQQEENTLPNGTEDEETSSNRIGDEETVEEISSDDTEEDNQKENSNIREEFLGFEDFSNEKIEEQDIPSNEFTPSNGVASSNGAGEETLSNEFTPSNGAREEQPPNNTEEKETDESKEQEFSSNEVAPSNEAGDEEDLYSVRNFHI